MSPVIDTTHTNPLTFFLALFRKDIVWIILNAVFYCLGTVMYVGMSYYVGRITDALNNDTAHIPSLLVAFGLVLIGNEVAYRIGHILEIRTNMRIMEQTKKTLFSYTALLSFGYFADRFAGQISHQINTVADSFKNMKNTVTNSFIDVSWFLIFSGCVLASLYAPLGFAITIWCFIFIAGLRFFIRNINTYAAILAKKESATTGLLVDTYSNIGTVKIYGKDFGQDRMFRQIEDEANSHGTVGWWSVYTYAYQGLSGLLLVITILAISAYAYLHNQLSVGQLVTIGSISLRLLDNVYQVGHVTAGFVQAYGECTQALQDLLVPPTIVDGDVDPDISTASNVALSYNAISFAYGPDKPVLSDFTLQIPAGQKIGIVGLSGAGKTTLINLLMRFFDPQSGKITINDVDITSLSLQDLRSHISFISQDTSLFHLSIRDNIQYGLQPVSQDDLENAARKAYAHDFIMDLPNGYDAIVGERGIKLSGGQRQRIAIARAILKDAPLFLLDEATSALDSDSEAKIQDALTHVMQGKTVIAIAHRLSTLQFMDRIIFIKNGAVIEDGTHSDLLAQGGHYATLWNMQSGGFLPE